MAVTQRLDLMASFGLMFPRYLCHFTCLKLHKLDIINPYKIVTVIIDPHQELNTAVNIDRIVIWMRYVFLSVTMKITVMWDVTPHRSIDGYKHVGGNC